MPTSERPADTATHDGIDARQLALVCRHSLKHSLRSGAGLVFVLLALFFGLSVAHIVISPFEALVSQGEEMGMPDARVSIEQQVVGFARPVVEWVLSPRASDDPEAQAAAKAKTREWVEFVLVERPALLSAILFIMLIGTPLIVSFGAFNQTAGDIGSRGLRYLLLRTDRSNIYYGRLLATVLLVVAVQALVVATIALYLGLKVQLYDGSAIVAWSLQGFFALVVLSLPYVAVCAWISAATDSAMASLVISQLVIGGVVLMALLGQFAAEYVYYVIYLLPWGIQNRLLAPDITTVALTTGGCLLYTIFYAWLGARRFRTRDL